MSIKEKTLQQAIKLLDALGCNYKVISSDGAEFGSLEVVKQQARNVRHRVFANTGYIDKVKVMSVGEVLTLNPPDGSTAEEMRSAVCGTAHRLLGSGNYVTSIENNHVEILRTA